MDTGDTTVDIGQAVFDDAGNELGSVRSITEYGFAVTAGEGIEALSIAHERPGEAGTAELMWRCDRQRQDAASTASRISS